MANQTLLLRSRPKEVRGESLATAAQALLDGRLVAFPTETVYGLGANIFIERAVKRIFTVKKRPQDNPFIVHIASFAQAKELMQETPRYFDQLAKVFWPGSLTLVVRRNAAVLDCITAGLDTVALRMPDHPVALDLIRCAGVPLAAPSANISGRPSPTDSAVVLSELQGKIFAVLDGGRCRVGIESTVLDLTRRSPVILRPGIITREEIEEVIGSHVTSAHRSPIHPSSPGMKYTHYAPETPLHLVLPSGIDTMARFQRLLDSHRRMGRRIGLLAPAGFSQLDADDFFSLLGGTPVEYARGIYQGLRALDAVDLDVILCPGIMEEGIGVAVMNRLRKAATKIIR